MMSLSFLKEGKRNIIRERPQAAASV